MLRRPAPARLHQVDIKTLLKLYFESDRIFQREISKGVKISCLYKKKKKQ